MELEAVLEGNIFRLLEPAKMQGKVRNGERVKLKVVRPRSRAQHNLLFHALCVIYGTWPEEHEFQPFSVDHLRYWLEVKAGWGEKVACKTQRDIMRVSASGWGRPIWFGVEDGEVYAYLPRSISYDKMQPEEFKQLMSKIDEILLREVGFSLSEAKESAITDDQF